MKNKDKKGFEPFQTSKLFEFQFGDPDAKVDDLLLTCPQTIRGVKEFLGGAKNIVLGERGAGKSALFRLVSEGKYKFSTEHTDKDKPRKQLIVSIDEDLDYITISNVIESRFVDKAKRPHGKYLFLWEIYVLSRVIERLADEFGYSEEIQALHDDFSEILGIPKKNKFRLVDFLTTYKVSTGVKIDHAGSISPTLSVEPAKDAHSNGLEVTDHQITLFRSRVRKAIRAKRAVVYVLVDKIDDFLVDLAYQEQKKSVQALLECTQLFRLPELKLKIFLRIDLFKRLDFEKGGYDKISPQVVRLEWTSDDIYAFVARRLLFNYERLQVKTPRWGISPEMLDLDPSFEEQARDLVANRPTNIAGLMKMIGGAFVLISQVKWSQFRRKSHSERKTNSLDAIFSKVVNFVFPSRVLHLTSNCKQEEILFKSFLAEHFKLGGDCPNPRLVLLFLNNTLDEAVAYYERNPDPACKFLKANEMDEYELILKEHISRGYRKLQVTARETVNQLSLQWRPQISRLFAGVGVPKECTGLTIDRLKTLTSWDDDAESFQRFVAFYTHLGLLVPENEEALFENRVFSLPLVMRICPIQSVRQLAAIGK
jgi:hypothetical protein